MSRSEIRLIDGSYGEGGGQVLRTALTLSILTGEPIRIERIRASRKKPGLRPQHLTAVRAAAMICNAELAGDVLDSQTILFAPGGPAQPGAYTFDVTEVSKGGSAGSVGLICQTILLPLALAGDASRLTLRGGTHVPWAPSAFYLAHTFLPAAKRMGVKTELNVIDWGFYPAGGGEIQATIQGRDEPLRPIQMSERGELKRIWGQAVATNLPAHIPQRMANRAQNVLAEMGLPARVEARRLGGAGPGT
ncbi:MAG TPA: RNA 3'-phosphate cyclase, partial [Chloroflexi bacterium]|nr:RNA 3'-phosphate cyclase [Chloroflexota bacterium]